MIRPSFSVIMLLFSMLLMLSACSQERPDPNAAFERLILKISQAEKSAASHEADDATPQEQALADGSVATSSRIEFMRLDALQALEEIDTGALPSEMVKLHDRLLAAYRSHVRMARFGYGIVGPDIARPYVVTHVSGRWRQAPRQLAENARFTVLSDAQDYIFDLATVKKALNDERLRFKSDAARGVLPPRPVLERAIQNISAFAETSAKDSVWVRALDRELNRISIFDPDTLAALRAEVTALVETDIQPSYRLLAESLRENLDAAPEELGAGALPLSARSETSFYKAALAIHAGADQDPDLLLADAIAQAQDLAVATSNLLAALTLPKTAPPPENTVGRYQLLETSRPALTKLDDDTALRALQDVLIAQLAAAHDMTAELTSYPLPDTIINIDATRTRDATMLTLLKTDTNKLALTMSPMDLATIPEWRLPVALYAFGLPGEALLHSPALQLPDDTNPALTRYLPFNASWRAYAEDLAAEAGLLDDAIEVRLGYLIGRQRRVSLMAADLGLNIGQWTTQETVDFLVANGYFTAEQALEQVLQIAALPGEAISAPFGRSMIRRMRQEARNAVGDNFDLKAFNDVVLTNGPRPIAFVEADVRSWVARRRPGLPPLPAADDPRGTPQPDPTNAVSPSDPS